ncbi:tetratricopeptide-like helical domain-containing protein [Cavenderia fasciculata]|uniref:Tetratricopeptide-like helical domain-containing protein n=1 Tax=Cavenderia fasciculata TaxID=261658 RepID=F4PZQ7_CACFS|nr:tetratricopeptide-like helical domain-containing protein [Cavenderia fasciculata]EGG18821.1 tetratricopeptide-like helical domain-containing protein [Cavenderia fasciculata]|eukprot:XP_004357283.1 tetratricopeptide-like helical domain-containing protein [Cavenderia fasciculata]
MAPPTKTAAAPKEVKLTTKDTNTLKTLSKLFDERKYKKAIKQADAFLKIHPTNVDALCFRTLTLYGLNLKEEAHAAGKQVVRDNMSSFTAWHTLGFLHRNDKNFPEALKCFRTAHRNNKESVQILKDMSLIQIFQRDYPGLLDSYKTLLHLQPGYKGHWIGLITTYHLMGSHSQAIFILDEFINVLDQENEGIRRSELILYKVQLLDESNELDKALSLLKSDAKFIVDKLWAKNKTGEIYIKKNMLKEAEKVFTDLIKLNPDNMNYHKKFWESKGIKSIETITKEQIEILKPIYAEWGELNPKSFVIQKIPLNFLPSDSEGFLIRLAKFSRHFLVKGIPSLFNNLKSLYNGGDDKKSKVIEKFFEETLQSLIEKGTLVGSDQQESPSTLLWCRYFLAQHYDRVGKIKESFEQIDKAIEHTPTNVDNYIVRAKLLKHNGDLVGAAQQYEHARQLDLADRYLNTKSALYALRADERDNASKIFKTVIDPNDSTMFNISEYQCMWYENELGQSYYRTGDNAMSLKALHLVDKAFTEFIEDQFDFFNHMQKKLTLRAYVDFLRWEDQVYKNKPFLDAAKLLVKVYLTLLKKPYVKPVETTQSSAGVATAAETASAPPTTTEPTATTTPVVKENEKKQNNKQNNKQTPPPPPKKDDDDEVEVDEKNKVDEDPLGEKLATVPNLLEQANKFLKTMLKFNPDSVDAHLLACQCYLEKRKYLLIIQSLLKVKQVVPNHPLIFKNVVAMYRQVEQQADTTDASVKKILEDEKANLFDGATSLLQFVEQYAAKHKDSHAHQFIAGEQLYHLTKDSAKALDLIVNSVSSSATASWDNCRENLVHLKSVFCDIGKIDQSFADNLIQQYTEKCKIRFPLANYFQPPKSIEQSTEESTTTTTTTTTTTNGTSN